MEAQQMQIGEVASLTGLSLRTIRYYEEMGLVAPSTRTTGGFRLYTASDVARLKVVKRMKPLDFRLEEMKDLLETLDGLGGAQGSRRDDLVSKLEMYLEAAQARVAAVREQLAIADGFASDLSAELSRHKNAREKR
ncbi:MerR family transcriptional regulator [Nocardioides sp.]|uniref:MerR family transcriptional regulator n=1 Tax=Nocardioides sp. TaxID=35761 RepID=UPI002732B815|nr:MerR family transcriptional regulator [Nocardioides sp.]MDP3894987.1 MerR family transcriptional regulator [Nocardioides sp.]